MRFIEHYKTAHRRWSHRFDKPDEIPQEKLRDRSFQRVFESLQLDNKYTTLAIQHTLPIQGQPVVLKGVEDKQRRNMRRHGRRDATLWVAWTLRIRKQLVL